jgi:ABC-2 type transport system permease protein
MANSFGALDQIIRSFAISKKDLKIYYSKGQVILMGILWPGFMFLSFAIGRQMPIESLMPGLIAISIFFTCSAISPVVFPIETQSRTLERLASCPVSIWTILLGDMLASALTGLIISIIPIILSLAVGATFIHPITMILGILIGSICFSTMALIFSFPPVNNPAPIQMLSTLIKFPLMFISGIFVPLSQLPDVARGISLISPLTYFTDLTRYAMGETSYYPVLVDLMVIVGFTIVFWIVAVSLHNRTLPKRV